MSNKKQKSDVILGTYGSLLRKLIVTTIQLEKYHMEHYEETIGLCKEFYIKKYNNNLFGILGVPKDGKRRHHMAIQAFRTMNELNKFAKDNKISLQKDIVESKPNKK